jgi:3alpha(or 20beta)-hydroxysteroid dehydrogenase
MPSRLDGRTIIVTGGTRGMGEAIVHGIVEGGGNVVFGGRDVASGIRIAKELGAHARYVQHDASSAADWTTIVETALQAFGAVNGLVNNAGILGKTPFDDIDYDLVRDLFATNQLGVILGIQNVVPALRKAGGGSIVNIGSVGATKAFAGIAAYTGTKAAVAAISRSAAVELAGDNIRVNTVHPGPIATKMLEDSMGADAHKISASVTPMGRVGQPSEIAAPVIFLLSDDSSYMTGAELAVDGGRAL